MHHHDGMKYPSSIQRRLSFWVLRWKWKMNPRSCESLGKQYPWFTAINCCQLSFGSCHMSKKKISPKKGLLFPDGHRRPPSMLWHYSEIRGLCLMKLSSKTLQNLSYFWTRAFTIITNAKLLELKNKKAIWWAFI